VRSDAAETRPAGSIEGEVGRIARQARKAGAEAAFRARVEERLRNLESQLDEVKSRLNGLLFFIAGTVLTQVILRLLI
jgi:hypothetical protein